jgi:hypothetical protein
MIFLKVSNQYEDPFRYSVGLSYVMVLCFTRAFEVPCNMSWWFLYFHDHPQPTTLCSHDIDHVQLIRSDYVCYMKHVNRDWRILYVKMVKIWSKQSFYNNLVYYPSEIIVYSKDMITSQGKSKIPVRYTLYLPCLFDLPCLWVDCDEKLMIKWCWKFTWIDKNLLYPLDLYFDHSLSIYIDYMIMEDDW